jgi:ABC-type bacteriocin/lantibiotic exporter with double-glycine peptidase domain
LRFKSLCIEPNILVLDEATSSVDAQSEQPTTATDIIKRRTSIVSAWVITIKEKQTRLLYGRRLIVEMEPGEATS